MYLKVIAHNMACPNWHVCSTQMNETHIYIYIELCPMCMVLFAPG